MSLRVVIAYNDALSQVVRSIVQTLILITVIVYGILRPCQKLHVIVLIANISRRIYPNSQIVYNLMALISHCSYNSNRRRVT